MVFLRCKPSARCQVVGSVWARAKWYLNAFGQWTALTLCGYYGGQWSNKQPFPHWLLTDH